MIRLYLLVHMRCMLEHTLKPRLSNVDVKTSMNHILSLRQTNVYKQLSQLTRENVTIQSSKTPRELTPGFRLSASRFNRQPHCYHNPKLT